MPGRRYNCDCGKKRYRDEPTAVAAARVDEQSHQTAVTVYRCPGGLAWHVTAHGFRPQALRSVGRRMAFRLSEHGRLDLGDFCARELRLDPRRQQRVHQCAEQMTELGLAAWDADDLDAPGCLVASDVAGLRRVVQIGLDAYRQEHT